VGDCEKNVSALRHVSDDDRHDTQYVDATVHTTTDQHFSYLLKFTAGRPYIRFTVPGKILRWGPQTNNLLLVWVEDARCERCQREVT